MDAVGPVQGRVAKWYAENARDLPWRRDGASAWSVMVSEFMLQQTPVARVLPAYESWMRRWPEPADLAVESAGEAIRMWGRLGYPRRALRLHAAAIAIVDRHGGLVPDGYDDLRALPGVGDYTACAIAVFAFGRRHPVLDTNVRRVLARAIDGVEHPPATISRAERLRATDLLPDADPSAAVWSIGLMELGALVCTATAPRCPVCPLLDTCAWRRAGSPPYPGPPRRGQTWAGTDRQCRGRLLGVVRDAEAPVRQSRLEQVWTDPAQRRRCLQTLVDDGLLVRLGADAYALP